jgi:hypothetical protein
MGAAPSKRVTSADSTPVFSTNLTKNRFWVEIISQTSTLRGEVAQISTKCEMDISHSHNASELV